MAYKARIRGIYATALTKLLVDHGFEIVQASEVIKERFSLEEEIEYYDIDIKDRDDRQGVKVKGIRDALEEFQRIARRKLFDCVIKWWKFPLDGVYVGKVLTIRNGIAYIDIGGTYGTLKVYEKLNLKPMDKVIVQVDKEHPGLSHPRLTYGVRVPGKYIVLIERPVVKISRKIHDEEARRKLKELGEKIVTDGLGIIWRSSAVNKPEELLEREYVELKRIRDEILRKASEADKPQLIWSKTYYFEALLPGYSKMVLDEIRRQVTPTIPYHHMYKASSRIICQFVDMAENLLKKGLEMDEVYSRFLETIDKYCFNVDDTITIYHIKYSGEVIKLGPARVLDISEKRDQVTVRREILGKGLYDGLNIEKKPGDYAITTLKLGEWFYETKYYRKNGEYIGSYININTPVEFHVNSIRYFDLEIDIAKLGDGEARICDVDSFIKLIENQKVGIGIAGKVVEVFEKLNVKPPNEIILLLNKHKDTVENIASENKTK